MFAAVCIAHGQEAPSQGDALVASRLTCITLPSGAQRLTDPNQIAQIATKLEELAGKVHRHSASLEMLAWPLAHASGGEDTRNQVKDTLMAAGYQYEEHSLPGNACPDIWALVAEAKGRQVRRFWFWVNDGSYIGLAWSRLESEATQPQLPGRRPVGPAHRPRGRRPPGTTRTSG